jgi:hypothetical protein
VVIGIILLRVVTSCRAIGSSRQLRFDRPPHPGRSKKKSGADGMRARSAAYFART